MTKHRSAAIKRREHLPFDLCAGLWKNRYKFPKLISSIPQCDIFFK
ncbi:hypothetical protein HMPREF9436_02982 [Faecalibacterium cf. prausnitzii KLE1255]|uniref:Uncharacterized protein n=1 Tax=Faecalibacterium cf. prausnitzii KLE1255 TaxID=748224 RepID=E2ZMQ7_9FIRM|nr:hypothetical protein HMPREF9436_02982 [Faecalibacterium cf. prausnitzii KLE1255]